MTPRFGAPPERERSYRRRPGAYAVLIRDDHILLTCQAAPHREFQLPGGGIDPGESAAAALHREVFEETGWAVSSARRIFAYRRYCYLPEYKYHAEKYCSIWVARPTRRLGAALEPGHSAHWVPVREAVNLLADPGSVAGLRLVLGWPCRL